jgi:hypothetical protein
MVPVYPGRNLYLVAHTTIKTQHISYVSLWPNLTAPTDTWREKKKRNGPCRRKLLLMTLYRRPLLGRAQISEEKILHLLTVLFFARIVDLRGLCNGKISTTIN